MNSPGTVRLVKALSLNSDSDQYSSETVEMMLAAFFEAEQKIRDLAPLSPADCFFEVTAANQLCHSLLSLRESKTITERQFKRCLQAVGRICTAIEESRGDDA